MSTNDNPTIIAGRAKGNATRLNASIALQPKVRDTSNTHIDCSINEARANK